MEFTMIYFLIWVMAITGITMAYAGFRLYSIFTYEERYDECSSFAMTARDIVHENDLTFIVCPRCHTSWDWIELVEHYGSYLNDAQIDDAIYSVGLLCPDCAESYEMHQDLGVLSFFDA
jgi:hypothetical protein